MCGEYDADFEDSTRVRARKAHKCYACRDVIRPGDYYTRTAQGADGTVSTYRHCLRCWAMLTAVSEHVDSGVRWDLNCGEMWEDPPPEVARLAFMTADEAQREMGEARKGGG